MNIAIHAKLPKGTRVRLCESVGHEVIITRASMVLEQECTSAMFAQVERYMYFGTEDVIVAIDMPGEWEEARA